MTWVKVSGQTVAYSGRQAAAMDSGIVKDMTMKMRLFAALVVCASSLHVGNGWAETLACPALAQAQQVGACPSEEELQYTFTGYCSDDNKAYRGETDVCTDYQRYRKMKNVALWESSDGRFAGYVSCELPPAAVRNAKPQAMQLLKQGTLSRLVCTYADGLQFTHRTRAQCQVELAACTPATPGCQARCD